MKARKIHSSRAARAPLFSRSSIGTAVAMALIATGAQAAETSVNAAYNGTVTGTATVNAQPGNTANVNAGISGANVGTTATGTPLMPNPVAASTSGNLIGASASGNSVINGIAAAPGALDSDATLGVSTQSGTISSGVTGSKLAVELNNFQTGSVVNTDNTISATSTLNGSTSSVSGNASSAPVAPVAGTATLNFPAGAPLFDAKGNVVVTTLQSATGATSNATLLGNTIDLQLTSGGTHTVTGTAALARNTAASIFKGNTAINTAEVQGGGAPGFAGSAVVSNLQVNGNGSVSASHLASNINSLVLGVVTSSTPGLVNELRGTLSVQGNAISSAATGNEAIGATAGVAGNRILIDGVSVAGSGSAATAGNNSTHAGVGVVSNVNSDLAILNSQGNLGTGLLDGVTALVVNGQVLAGAQGANGAQLTLAGNSVTADATGNVASSAIASAGSAASFAGTAAVGNQQANANFATSAAILSSIIAAQTGDATGQTTGSTVAVTDNRSAATAQSNRVDQSLSIEANTIALGTGTATLTGGTSSDGRVSAAGAATLSNLQGNYGSLTTTINVNSQIQLTANGGTANTVSDSALTLARNRQEAVALGNGASNALTLAGNAVGAGAGIASVQMNDAGSSVGAVLVTPQAAIVSPGSLSGGTLALTDNVQRAISYGNSAGNTVAVTAGNVAVAPSLGAASTVNVNLASNLPFDNTPATQPTVTAAYGVLNDQSTQATVGSTAVGVNSLLVTVGGNATNTGVSNDRNAFVAASYGNDAASGVKIDAGNIAGTFPLFAPVVANVTNTQSVAGAGTNIESNAVGGTPVRTYIAGAVAGSSVSSSDNATEALAVGSRATGNTVDVTATSINTAGLTVPLPGASLAGGALTTTAAFGVQNAQSGQGAVTATRSGGAEVLTTVGGNLGGSTIDADRNTTLASAASNSASNGVSLNAGGISTTGAVQNLQLNSATVTSTIGQEGASLALQGGAQVVVGGASLSASLVSVDNNVVGGTASGNAATNGIAVKGTAIASGQFGLLPAVAVNIAGTATANADYAVSNTQLDLGTAPISSKVSAAFGVDTAPGAVIAGSTLSASGNTQSADASANSAGNSVALTAGSVGARSAIQSGQGSVAAVEARSFMQAFAPASVANSTVAISDNSNTASGVVNDVSNKIALAADNTTGLAGPAAANFGVLGVGVSAAVGDQVIVNRQSAATSVGATVDTQLYNEDRTVPATSGIVNSSFALSGNSAEADATTNRATNALSVLGGATQGAKTAVLSVQDSAAAVTAKANEVAKLTLTGGAALINSSVALDGNSLSGAATGSAATNTIAVKGSSIGGSTGAAQAGAGAGFASAVQADHALSNVQTGTGAVTSTVTGSVGVDTANNSSIGNSTVSVSNNSQSAKAVGNTALNSIALDAASVAARTALQSTQAGSAPVTATSTSTLFAPVASSGSSVRIVGNGNTALGVINDVTNALSVSAANAQPPGATGSGTLSETGSTDNLVATGDHVLSNRQTASSSVRGTATTTIGNDDAGVAGTQGLANGTLGISGNTTLAEASANRAVNAVAVAAGATQGASTGIVNAQTSSAAATASASTAATVSLAGLTPLNGGSISVDGNTTAALARGNAATNVLDIGAGGGYGGASAAGSSSLVAAPLALNLSASAGILNSQSNSGAVSASSAGTSYQVALNATGLPATNNGTVGITGNTLAAQAVGNSAVNRVTQTALNTGAPSTAIANYQVNTGNVTATVTSVSFGAGVSGGVGNSALRTTGNQVTASATGNSSASTIAAR